MKEILLLFFIIFLSLVACSQIESQPDCLPNYLVKTKGVMEIDDPSEFIVTNKDIEYGDKIFTDYIGMNWGNEGLYDDMWFSKTGAWMINEI